RNLALLRSERRTAPCLPFAWINQERRRDHWRVDPEARAFFEAAQRRAEENGYRVEVFWTREPGMTSGRILQILRTRGIEGVLFAAHRTFDLSLLDREWNEFSVIGLNDHRLAEWLDVVSP